MSYSIQRAERVTIAVRRIALEQIEKMINQLDDPQAAPHATVHDVRKRCKKLRGLLRLVRPALAGKQTYKQENAWYADAARSLSEVRDSQSIIETLDTLLDRYREHIEPGAFDSVRENLVERRQEITHEQGDVDDRLKEFRHRMLQGRKRAGQWKLEEKSFAAIAGGLEKTYARGCKAKRLARKQSTAENLHEWRKRTKYHWYHSRLLKNLWKPEMSARAKLAKDLSDLLGDDHDLSILTETLTADPSGHGEPTTIETLLGLIHSRRKELQLRARLQGKRLYAEKPAALVDRLEVYWNAWQKEEKLQPEKFTAHQLKLVEG